MDKIEFLRRRALDNVPCADRFYLDFYKKYSSDSRKSEWQKYADAYYYAFSNYIPTIYCGELIVGAAVCNMSPDEQNEWDIKYRSIARARVAKAGAGQDSHMAIDYELVLTRGLYGIIDTINEKLALCDGEKAEFYRTCKKCLEAVIVYSSHYADEAQRQAQDTCDEKRRAELSEIARICRKVPAYPAESFYEAVQSVHFISHCLSFNPFRMGFQQFQLGHPDRYLLPYYEKDISSGKITKQQAQLLLDCLGIQINMRVPNGLSCGYMVGGRDADGRAVANDLTEMLMQVIDDIRLVYPSVGLCYNTDMDDKYIEKACKILTHGRSHPAIFGDDTISKGLMSYGIATTIYTALAWK